MHSSALSLWIGLESNLAIAHWFELHCKDHVQGENNIAPHPWTNPSCSRCENVNIGTYGRVLFICVSGVFPRPLSLSLFLSLSFVDMDALDWIGLDWMDCIGLGGVGLDWIGLDWFGLDWIGLD